MLDISRRTTVAQVREMAVSWCFAGCLVLVCESAVGKNRESYKILFPQKEQAEVPSSFRGLCSLIVEKNRLDQTGPRKKLTWLSLE